MPDEIRALERSRLKALVSGDMKTAQQLHAPEFELITPSGLHLSRDEYLNAVAAGSLKYLVWDIISEIEVRYYGDSAFIRYRSRLDVVSGDPQAVADDAPTKPLDIHWHTDLYERREGGWQVVRSQATRIEDESKTIQKSAPDRELSTKVIHSDCFCG